MIEELKELQDQLAFIDLLNQQSNSSLTEVLLKKLLPLEFRMEPDHHGAPHIHINYGKLKHAASYTLHDAERKAGDLPNKYDKVVKSWITTNQLKLNQIWNEMKAGNQLKYELLIGQLL